MGAPGGLISFNMFAYCQNNPVIYKDSCGMFLETIADITSVGLSLCDFVSNPNLKTLGFLVWDMSATVLPGIPGSYVYKGAKLLKGVSGLRRFTSSNFRRNLIKLIGNPPSWMKKAEAHHILPQKFESFFSSKGLNINDPRFGTWVEKSSHVKWSKSYNDYWADFINKYGPSASPEQILNFGRNLANKYGFNVNY